MNLLRETIDILKIHGKTLDDILFIKCDYDSNFKVTTEQLEEILNVEYYNDFGGVDINLDLKLVGQNFWLERDDCDGFEWWEYKELPIYDPGKETHLNQIVIKYSDEVEEEDY